MGIILAVSGWLFLAYGPALPEAPTASAPEARGPLTRAKAEQIWNAYRTGLHNAVQTRDIAPLNQVERGLTLEMTRTRHRIDHQAGENPPLPGGGTVQYVIPRTAPGQDRWFAVIGTGKKAYATVLAETAGGWRAVARVAARRHPRIAKDGAGHAIPVADDERNGKITPREAADGLARYFSVPAAENAGALLKPGPLTTQTRARIDRWRRQWGKGPDGWEARRTEAVQRSPFYAVKTEDGGALIWFATVQTNTYTAREAGRGARLDISDAKALTDSRYFKESITTTNGRIYLAQIGRDIDVLAIRDQLLTVKGD